MNDLKFTTAEDYMNDTNNRIKEFEKECWSHRVNGTLVDGQLHFDTQKFAELIIRECAEIATINAHQWQTPGTYILKHFEVE